MRPHREYPTVDVLTAPLISYPRAAKHSWSRFQLIPGTSLLQRVIGIDPLLDKAPRPLTFLWNGGPGSSSSLVRLLGFGPRRLRPDGAAVDNQGAWLDHTEPTSRIKALKKASHQSLADGSSQ